MQIPLGWHRLILATVTLATTLDPGGSLARADQPSAPLHIVMLSGSDEYESARTLPAFAQELTRRFGVSCRVLQAQGVERLPGLEALDDCDLMIVFTRRLRIQGDDLARVQGYCASGKPIISIRTGSHGFQNWLEFDRIHLGGNYRGHYNKNVLMTAHVVPDHRDHPILKGLEVAALRSRSSLYQSGPLAEDCQALVMGRTAQGEEPIVWVRDHAPGRVAAISIGSPEDFENGTFRQLLIQTIAWATGRPLVEPQGDPPPPSTSNTNQRLTWTQRRRLIDHGQVQVVETHVAIPARRVAFLICDMWDDHWCPSAARRCDQLAQRMASLVDRLRQAGVTIIHCPSDTMGFYRGHPAREWVSRLPRPAADRFPVVERPDPPLPIDDSDQGCDTPGVAPFRAWMRQNRRLSIHPEDAITDNGEEVLALITHRGIEQVIVAGVHTNMCVLNRSFGIKALTRRGVSCVLARDLTDAMYNPASPPYVSHERGTELVVEHIETHWCPSLDSASMMVDDSPAAQPAASSSSGNAPR